MSEKNMKTFSIVVFTDFLFYVYHFRQNPPPLCFSMKPNRCVCTYIVTALFLEDYYTF